MIKKFQENNPAAVRINFQDAHMAIGRLGFAPMSDTEKFKNNLAVDIPYYKAKHDSEIICAEFQDPQAYRIIRQLKIENVLSVLACHAYYEMRQADRYYEDSPFPKKLSKTESTLYENIFKNGVVVVPVEEQPSIIYNRKDQKHLGLVKDGEDFMEHCNIQVRQRREWLTDEVQRYNQRNSASKPEVK